jgi:hypothetical protein
MDTKTELFEEGQSDQEPHYYVIAVEIGKNLERVKFQAAIGEHVSEHYRSTRKISVGEAAKYSADLLRQYFQSRYSERP